MADGMQQVIEWPHTCNEGVTVRGMYEPCEATAVAVRLDPDEHTPYPVCARHCRGELVPLRDVVAAAQEVTCG